MQTAGRQSQYGSMGVWEYAHVTVWESGSVIKTITYAEGLARVRVPTEASTVDLEEEADEGVLPECARTRPRHDTGVPEMVADELDRAAVAQEVDVFVVAAAAAAVVVLWLWLWLRCFVVAGEVGLETRSSSFRSKPFNPQTGLQVLSPNHTTTTIAKHSVYTLTEPHISNQYSVSNER